MIYPAEADIVPLVKNLVQGLQPYAQANQVRLAFTSAVEKQVLPYQPFLLLQSLSRLICQVINLVPHQSGVQLRLHTCTEKQQLLLEVENTGINLIRVNGIGTQGMYAFNAHPLPNGTMYRLALPLHDPAAAVLNEHSATNNAPPKFYAEIQKRLRSHFTQAEKLVAALAYSRPHEATFLQKINALIKANLEHETFDTNALCKAMAMSRTQLFRRLKPLIRQAPARYIKTMRLQKAKALLETTDFTVGEIAFKTGFQNGSHFTKIFQQQYGLLPSVFRRGRKPATNE